MPTKKQSEASKRQLVRWNEGLDKFLMLAIQSVCNNRGVKIPWDLVAEVMGPPITEGAVVQHLAKLRQRMEESGQPVPPPLRRGGATPIAKPAKGQGADRLMGGSSGSKSAKRKARALDDDGDDTEGGIFYGKAERDDSNAGGSSKKKSKGKASQLKTIKVDDSDEYEEAPVKKNRIKVKKQEYDDEDDDYEDHSGVPYTMPSIIRNRIRSIDYAKLNGEGDSDGDFDKSSGQASSEPTPSKEVRSKVIVLPVCLRNLSEKSPAIKVKEEESDYDAESPPGSEIGTPDGSAALNSSVSRGKKRVSNTSASTQNSYAETAAPKPQHAVAQASNALMDALELDPNDNAGNVTMSHGYRRPNPMSMGPPISYLANQSRAAGNGMRIDTNFNQGFNWSSGPADSGYLSYSSLDPSPTMTPRSSIGGGGNAQALYPSASFLGVGNNYDDEDLMPNMNSDPPWMHFMEDNPFGGDDGTGFDFGGQSSFDG